jgi:hypothetical protein
VAELFSTGRIVDLILALIVLEAVVLMIVRAATGQGVAAVDLVSLLAPGAALLLALRATATGHGWVQTAAWLLAALAAHLVDLTRRWKHTNRS